MTDVAAVGEALDKAISDALRNSDQSMVTNWVLCATVIDADGTTSTWALSAAGQKRYATLGLLTYALYEEQAGAVAERLSSDD